MAKKIVTVLIAVAVLGGGVAIVASSMSSGVFSLTIAEAQSAPERLAGKELKVTGDVVSGSIRRGATPFEMDFAIADKEGRRLDCHYKGAIPDPFAEGREVILQGALGTDRKLEVSKITVKCPSKYQEAGIAEDRYDDYYGKKYKDGHRNP
ncbi:MAG: cytochrome c maturation protein CcmE [Deltaproteobacteria bacterium]|nr:cytochrome c maturation protein CcmE [Deltaproteobacteria bacterium]